MQDARDAYYTAKYSPQLGVQGFYDTLLSHTQNMSVYPDSYNIMDTFLRGLTKDMCSEMLKNGLTPEANTVEDFVTEGKAIEDAMKTLDHYNRQIAVPISKPSAHYTTNPKDRNEPQPKRIRVTFIKKSDVRAHKGPSYDKPRVFLSTKQSPCLNFASKPFTPKRQTQPNEKDRDKLNSGPGKQEDLCYKCSKPGHFAKDHFPGGKLHLRVAHTEVQDNLEDKNIEDHESSSSRTEPDNGGQNDPNSDDEEVVEVDVYDNDRYERDSDTERVFAARDQDEAKKDKEEELILSQSQTKDEAPMPHFCKVKLRAEKTARY
jgi:hypothetical protein